MRSSRWWWRPGPAGVLVVCVAGIDDDVAGEFGVRCGAAGGPVSRMAGRSEFLDRLSQVVQHVADREALHKGRGEL